MFRGLNARRLLGVIVVAAAVCGAWTGVRSGGEAKAESSAGADWVGMVTFAGRQSYVVTDNARKLVSRGEGWDRRIYRVLGPDKLTLTGGSQTKTIYKDVCGRQVDYSLWRLGPVRAPGSVSIRDDGITFSMGVVDAVYRYGASGRTDPRGEPPVCGGKRQPLPPTKAGTGAPTFEYPVRAKRRFLLRTVGSVDALPPGNGGGRIHAASATLPDPGTSWHITWNLKRDGLDRDRDFLDDRGDPNPRNPDSDFDGFPDGFEVDQGSSATDSRSRPRQPYTRGAPDSDRDGYSDGQEVAVGKDPQNGSSHPSGKGDTPKGPTTFKPGEDKKGGKPDEVGERKYEILKTECFLLNGKEFKGIEQAAVRVTARMGVTGSSSVNGYEVAVRIGKVATGTNWQSPWKRLAAAGYPTRQNFQTFAVVSDSFPLEEAATRDIDVHLTYFSPRTISRPTGKETVELVLSMPSCPPSKLYSDFPPG